jgi:hypothetical protein
MSLSAVRRKRILVWELAENISLAERREKRIKTGVRRQT